MPDITQAPIITGSALGYGADGTQYLAKGTANRGQAVGQVEPAYFELARAGRIYTAQFGVVTNAVASVVDVPTTGAHFALYNGNTAASGLHLAILGYGVTSASGTVGIGAAIVGGVSGGAQAAALTTTAGNLIVSDCGSSRTTAATADSTVTLTTAPAWGILGTTNTISGVAIGYGMADYNVNGRFIVPATYVFALAVVSPTGTSPKFIASITYAELKGDLV